MLNQLVFLIYLVILILLISSGFVAETTGYKMRLTSISISAICIVGGILFMSLSGIKIHMSFGLGPIIIGFIVILGISLIVLLSSKFYIEDQDKVFENYSTSPISENVGSPCLIQDYGNLMFSRNRSGCIKYESNPININNPLGGKGLTRRTSHPVPCQTIDSNNNTVWSTLNSSGLCMPTKDYGIRGKHDGIVTDEEGIYGRYGGVGDEEGGGGKNIAGVDGHNIKTLAEQEEDLLAEQEELQKEHERTGCVIPDEDSGCQDISIDPQKYCENMGEGLGMKSTQQCCSLPSTTTGNDELTKKKQVITCAKGYINGVSYSPTEMASMTKCVPMTSDFNYECQYSNPPCANIDINDCDNNDMCDIDEVTNLCALKKDANYAYKNYSSREFGFKKILQGDDGACPSNNYGRALCSPQYYSGIRKVPNASSCLSMDSDNFNENCMNEYGMNKDNLGSNNADGCNPGTTRKMCKSSNNQSVNYIGCFSNAYDRESKSVNSVSECVGICNKDISNKYAAITQGGECSCGTSYEDLTKNGQVSNDSCNIECERGVEKNCGGNHSMALYKL